MRLGQQGLLERHASDEEIGEVPESSGDGFIGSALPLREQTYVCNREVTGHHLPSLQ
jgi:hypothetical protein